MFLVITTVSREQLDGVGRSPRRVMAGELPWVVAPAVGCPALSAAVGRLGPHSEPPLCSLLKQVRSAA